jgi:hypothetical protein
MGLQRTLYLMARTVGDINAAKKGRLGRRLVRRQENRLIWRLIKKVRR